ncbi:MAG: DEAD/DEAH box helicase, partial [Planctomycetota bacterium]
MSGGGRDERVVEGLFGAEVDRGSAGGRASAKKKAGARPKSAPVDAALFAEVALNRPMRQAYTYAVTADYADRVAPGVRVAVPFAGRREIGVVVSTSETTDVDAARVKPVSDVLDAAPVLDAHLLELTRWMADYYACSWGECLAAVLPAAMKREGGRRTVAVVRPADGVSPERLAELEGTASAKQHRVLRTLLDATGPVSRVDLKKRLNVTDAPIRTLERKGLVAIDQVIAPPDDLLSGEREARPRHAQLTPDQADAVAALDAAVDEGAFAPTLLYGVTGSGKTEVYLRVIEHALERGKGAIVLVPEIALTPQTVGWFVDRFGAVAVLHSGMTDAQRLSMWNRVRD